MRSCVGNPLTFGLHVDHPIMHVEPLSYVAKTVSTCEHSTTHDNSDSSPNGRPDLQDNVLSTEASRNVQAYDKGTAPTMINSTKVSIAPSSNDDDRIENLLQTRFHTPMYYSTNSWVKWFINTVYRSKKHYVWCADAFSGSRFGFPVAPSSTPKDIYKELLRDVQGRDRHSVKINQQRATLTGLCSKWFPTGGLEYEEIVHFLADGDFSKWRPVIYVIPQNKMIADRLRIVRPPDRAGVAREYIIEDLDESEFDLIEP